MSLTSTLTTIHSNGVKVKGTDAEFNEAIYDGWEASGWEWDDAAVNQLKMPSGRMVPEVARIRNGKFEAMGYEAEEPEEYAYMYAAFTLGFAQDIADNISEGYLILSHEIEGNGTEYYLVQPGNAVEIDIIDTIVQAYGLTR